MVIVNRCKWVKRQGLAKAKECISKWVKCHGLAIAKGCESKCMKRQGLAKANGFTIVNIHYRKAICFC